MDKPQSGDVVSHDVFINELGLRASLRVQRHIDDRLGDLCEQLGWDRYTYLRLRIQANTTRAMANIKKFEEAWNGRNQSRAT